MPYVLFFGGVTTTHAACHLGLSRTNDGIKGEKETLQRSSNTRASHRLSMPALVTVLDAVYIDCEQQIRTKHRERSSRASLRWNSAGLPMPMHKVPSHFVSFWGDSRGATFHRGPTLNGPPTDVLQVGGTDMAGAAAAHHSVGAHTYKRWRRSSSSHPLPLLWYRVRTATTSVSGTTGRLSASNKWCKGGVECWLCCIDQVWRCSVSDFRRLSR